MKPEVRQLVLLAKQELADSQIQQAELHLREARRLLSINFPSQLKLMHLVDHLLTQIVDSYVAVDFNQLISELNNLNPIEPEFAFDPTHEVQIPLTVGRIIEIQNDHLELDDQIIDTEDPVLLSGTTFPSIDSCSSATFDSDWKKPRKPESSEFEGLDFRVWFGTNRKPIKGGFGSERNGQTTHGYADVWVPRFHRFGETGNPWWMRLLRMQTGDDHLVLKSLTRLNSEAYFNAIQSLMESIREDGSAPQALVYLHGFNVSFEDAAIRAAQLGCDLKIPGAVAFFSWPSKGDLSAYLADASTIEASEEAIAEFLLDFVNRSSAERIHVVAHSMGNRGLLRALQHIYARVEKDTPVKFGQIFLAAPDVDRDLFLRLAHLFTEHGERTTLYASDRDMAVRFSAMIHEAPRAGYYEPYTIANGIDTIAVPNMNVDLLGHSYFAEAEGILHDMHDLISHGEPPSHRQRLNQASCPDGMFWRLCR